MYATYEECRFQLTDKDKISNYIKGGKGVLTLAAPSGKHYTYSFRRPKNTVAFPEGTMFVYVRCSDLHWEYLGMVIGSNLAMTAKSYYPSTSDQFRGAAYILRMASKDMDTPMKLYHEGVCACCGRKLTDPKSIEFGIGPTCRKLINYGK